ncbi:MAG: DOPA 4,5-dioxygenase family protein [Motiliproteus sp.]|nr:DOPA 4,5-dioxygenase family protein [Motiliproteus sp.]MCW9053431.1 DOPA 4,5-dioxygenase family protein [Motiliproteus sp.]
MTKRPENIHTAYHAHVYYDQDSLEHAQKLCEQAGTLFNVNVGRLHQQNVGPHPCWSCQIAFSKNQFEQLIPWLDQQRQGLSILIHGVTGDDWKDHTDHVSWLGDAVELNLSFFKKLITTP